MPPSFASAAGGGGMGFRMQHRNAADTSASGRDRYILLLLKNAGASLSNARGSPHLAVRNGRQAGRSQGSVMSYRMAIGVTVVAALCAALVGAQAHDESKYPDWGGQWKRPRGIGTQWDQTKPLGRAQEAPLTPEFQAVLEASIKDQASGGQGNDPHVTCVSNGVPRIMTATFPIAFVITPAVTYVHFE